MEFILVILVLPSVMLTCYHITGILMPNVSLGEWRKLRYSSLFLGSPFSNYDYFPILMFYSLMLSPSFSNNFHLHIPTNFTFISKQLSLSYAKNYHLHMETITTYTFFLLLTFCSQLKNVTLSIMPILWFCL